MTQRRLRTRDPLETARAVTACTALLLAILPRSAPAESSLRFPVPESFESVPAVAYDSRGTPIGKASMVFERTGPEAAQLVGTVTLDRGGSTTVQTDFRVVDEGRHLRPIRQISQSVTVEGHPLGTLLIEHEKATATCTPPPDSGQEPHRLDLPEPDRVANVPLHLLFAPLAQGHAKAIDFDVLLCRDNPRFMDFAARVEARDRGASGAHSVEIRYAPNFGPLFSFLASGMLPELRFWLGGEKNDRYIGHRMPLYSKGPEVWVIREGMGPQDLVDDSRAPFHPSPVGEPEHETRSHPTGR